MPTSTRSGRYWVESFRIGRNQPERVDGARVDMIKYRNRAMKVNSMSEIAIIVQQERKRQGATQIELSQMANVGVRFLRDVEAQTATHWHCHKDKQDLVRNGRPAHCGSPGGSGG